MCNMAPHDPIQETHYISDEFCQGEAPRAFAADCSWLWEADVGTLA